MEVRFVRWEAELVATGSITLPAPAQRTARWWRQLSTGDGARKITTEAAMFAIQVITIATLGLNAASGLQVDFDGGEQTLRDLWDAVQQLCGQPGWQALVKKGEA